MRPISKHLKPVIWIILSLILFSNAYSQSENKLIPNDSINHQKIKKIGFAWGGTPILAFDADLGFRYGAVINLFDYGKGEYFPDYLQYALIKAFQTTKGASNISLLFDSEKIIPRNKLIFETTYIKDIALDFYGFNGINSIVQQSLITPEHPDYLNTFFYNHQRQLMRFRVDFQKFIASRKFRLFFGFAYNNYKISTIDFENFNIPNNLDGSPLSPTTLYQRYIEWDIIPEEERAGGHINYFSTGLIYDTRNSQINCSDGIALESFLVLSKKPFSSQSFTKHILSFRHYIHWNKRNMVFFYRLNSQHKLSGKIPFYFAPVFFDTKINQDGLGGAFNLRGINRNRIVGDGFILGNFEVRKKVSSFRFKKLNFNIELSLFTDAAFITQEYKVNTNNVPDNYQSVLFQNKKQKINNTLGLGMYIIYNVNNIISINYGFSPDKQLGNGGLYIGSGFLF